MTEQANPDDKGLRILMEALTTISYLKGAEGKAAAIAEYALDQYGKTLQMAKASEGRSEAQSISADLSEHRNHPPRRRFVRRHVKLGPPAGLMERRLGADRRVNPDRRCNP